VTEAYKRFGKLSLEELEMLDTRKLSVVEASLINALKRAAEASDWQAAHAALKGIADRTDGKPEQRKTIEQHNTSLDLSAEMLMKLADKVGRSPISQSQAIALLECVAEIDAEE